MWVTLCSLLFNSHHQNESNKGNQADSRVIKELFFMFKMITENTFEI